MTEEHGENQRRAQLFLPWMEQYLRKRILLALKTLYSAQKQTAVFEDVPWY